MSKAMTCGVHHVGLAVPDLVTAAEFFTGALGWKLIGLNDSYPSAFVLDDTVMGTLAPQLRCDSFRSHSRHAERIDVAAKSDSLSIPSPLKPRIFGAVSVVPEPGNANDREGEQHGDERVRYD